MCFSPLRELCSQQGLTFNLATSEPFKGKPCIHYRKGTHRQWFDTPRSDHGTTCQWSFTFQGIIGIAGQEPKTLPVGIGHFPPWIQFPPEPHQDHLERPLQRFIFRFCSRHSQTNSLRAQSQIIQSSCHVGTEVQREEAICLRSPSWGRAVLEFWPLTSNPVFFPQQRSLHQPDTLKNKKACGMGQGTQKGGWGKCWSSKKSIQKCIRAKYV